MAGKSKLKGNAESLDGHDGDGADSRANRKVDESVLLAMNRGDLVNHENGKSDNSDSVEEKACKNVLGGTET